MWPGPIKCLDCGVVAYDVEKVKHRGHRIIPVVVVEWRLSRQYVRGAPFQEKREYAKRLVHVCGGELKMLITPRDFELVCDRCGSVWKSEKIRGTLVEEYLKTRHPFWSGYYSPEDRERLKWLLAERIEKAGLGRIVEEDRLLEKNVAGSLRLVKAAKEWKCALCGKTIAKGEVHYLITYKDWTTYFRSPGSWSRARYGYRPIPVTRRTTARCRAHVTCVEAWRRVKRDGS